MARNTRKNMFNVEISVGRKNCEPDYCTCTSTVSSSGMTMIADGAPRCRRPALVCMSTATTERAASRDVSLSAVTMTSTTTKRSCFERGWLAWNQVQQRAGQSVGVSGGALKTALRGGRPIGPGGENSVVSMLPAAIPRRQTRGGC